MPNAESHSLQRSKSLSDLNSESLASKTDFKPDFLRQSITKQMHREQEIQEKGDAASSRREEPRHVDTLRVACKEHEESLHTQTSPQQMHREQEIQEKGDAASFSSRKPRAIDTLRVALHAQTPRRSFEDQTHHNQTHHTSSYERHHVDLARQLTHTNTGLAPDREHGLGETPSSNENNSTFWGKLQAAYRWNNITGNTIVSYTGAILSAVSLYYTVHPASSTGTCDCPSNSTHSGR